MAAILLGDKKVVLPEYRQEYKEKYWTIISELVNAKVGREEITDSEQVVEILKECFITFCQEFSKAIEEIPEAAFFLFCNDVHEDSIDLWTLQLEGETLNLDEEQFAASRRVLKIVLEQGTRIELKGNDNFLKEANEKQSVYIEHLEKLMYLGVWSISISEEIAMSQLFPKSKGIQIRDGELNILTYQPYPELFKFVHFDVSRHNSNVQVSEGVVEFKDLLRDKMNVEYDILASFINQKLLTPNYNYSITEIEPLVETLKEELDCEEQFIEDFYEGLTVSRRNVLPIEECILKNQDMNRFMFRPILEYTIDEKVYNIVGYNKWSESFTSLSTNCFPFGHYPNEWKKHQHIKEFVQKVTLEHDDILEDPIAQFLEGEGVKFSRNVKSLMTRNGSNIPLEVEGLGEIDLIFLDEENKVIYIGECKHNRSRFDVNNWKRDYSNFEDTYETQLSNKENWAIEHLTEIAVHFELKYNVSLDFSDYILRAIFLINAPTIYMYNGEYRAFTFTDLKRIVRGTFESTIFQFTNEDTDQTFNVGHPYFKELKKAMGE